MRMDGFQIGSKRLRVQHKRHGQIADNITYSGSDGGGGGTYYSGIEHQSLDYGGHQDTKYVLETRESYSLQRHPRLILRCSSIRIRTPWRYSKKNVHICLITKNLLLIVDSHKIFSHRKTTKKMHREKDTPATSTRRVFRDAICDEICCL